MAPNGQANNPSAAYSDKPLSSSMAVNRKAALEVSPIIITSPPSNGNPSLVCSMFLLICS
ncbi:hypothetical protein DsansV1_C09g0093671 [Dioscorea sansibarensis]